MPSKPTDVDALNITIADDGTATLTGINYDDLRSILTAASLYRYDHPVKVDPLDGQFDEMIHQNNMHGALWHLHSHFLIDVLSFRVSNAMGHGTGDLTLLKALHQHKVNDLEDKVREAEIAALNTAKETPDLIAEAAAEISKALRAADSAVAKLNHARSEVRNNTGQNFSSQV